MSSKIHQAKQHGAGSSGGSGKKKRVKRPDTGPKMSAGRAEDKGLDLLVTHLDKEASSASTKGKKKKGKALTKRQQELQKENQSHSHSSSASREVHQSLQRRREIEQAAEQERHRIRSERRRLKGMTSGSGSEGAAGEKEASEAEVAELVRKGTSQTLQSRQNSKVPPRVFDEVPGFFCTAGSKPRQIIGLPALAIQRLKLNDSHLRKFLSVYNNGAQKHQGRIMTFEEFLSTVDSVDSEFVRVVLDKLVFSTFDMTSDLGLDFDEFVLTMTLLGICTKDEMLDVLFGMFDKDGSGKIDRQEFKAVAGVLSVHFEQAKGIDFRDLLKKYDSNQDGYINRSEFEELYKDFAAMFHPAFKIIDEVRTLTLGASKWRSLQTEYYDKEARNKNTHSFTDNLYIEISQIDRAMHT